MRSAAANHGGFVSAVAALTGTWHRQGLIRSLDRARIITAAAQSRIGHRRR